MKDTEEGIGVLARAVQIDPELAGVYANLGVFQLAQGEQVLAEQAFQKAVSVAPTSVEALMNLGNFFKATRKWADAEKAMQRAQELEPKNLHVMDALASLYVASGRPNLAEPYFKSMVEIANDEKSRLALTGYYISVNRFPDALKTLQELASDKKHYARASVGIAMLEYAMGDRPRAHKLIDEVLVARAEQCGRADRQGAAAAGGEENPRGARADQGGGGGRPQIGRSATDSRPGATRHARCRNGSQGLQRHAEARSALARRATRAVGFASQPQRDRHGHPIRRAGDHRQSAQPGGAIDPRSRLDGSRSGPCARRKRAADHPGQTAQLPARLRRARAAALEPQ